MRDPTPADAVADLQRAARALVAAHFPGHVAVEVSIALLESERPVRLFVPRAPVPAPRDGAPAPPRRKAADDAPAPTPGVFEPSELQADILEALEWTALNADALAEAVGVSRRYLYRKPGGIGELTAQDMVRVEKGVGYYRPDMPPDGLPDDLR